MLTSQRNYVYYFAVLTRNLCFLQKLGKSEPSICQRLRNNSKIYIVFHSRYFKHNLTLSNTLTIYFPGRINNSHVVSELVYALSNLLVLFNDRIINHVRQIELPSSGDRLKLWLTAIEYCEVFCELTAKKLWGNRGKWLIIVAIQVFK